MQVSPGDFNHIRLHDSCRQHASVAAVAENLAVMCTELHKFVVKRVSLWVSILPYVHVS